MIFHWPEEHIPDIELEIPKVPRGLTRDNLRPLSCCLSPHEIVRLTDIMDEDTIRHYMYRIMSTLRR